MNSHPEQLKTHREVLRNARGFSLIEILIALTLLGIAGTFVASQIFQQLQEGRVSAAKIQMNGYKQALMDFKRKCAFYPSTEQGLDALVSKPSGGRECRSYPPSGFIERIERDPWDFDYVYESDGRKFSIYSTGADGVEGGEGDDQDIYLNEDQQKANAEAGDDA